MSTFESLLKSPRAMETENPPVEKELGAAKVPNPLPSITVILLALSPATATSALPSRLKSATATACGFDGKLKEEAAVKLTDEHAPVALLGNAQTSTKRTKATLNLFAVTQHFIRKVPLDVPSCSLI